MTKEERKVWYHDWYWNRGGREQTLQRRRERGPLKWGTKLNNGNQQSRGYDGHLQDS